MKRLIAVFLLTVLLAGCGTDKPLPEQTVAQTTAPEETILPEVTEPKRELETLPVLSTAPPYKTPNVDRYRPGWNVGSCRRLEGKVYAVVFLVDDVSSSWTEETGQEFLLRCVTPGFAYLQEQAEYWGVELEFDYYFFMTDEKNSMYYPREFSPELDGAVDNSDILDVLAGNFGFADKFSMNLYFESYFDTDEVLYFVALNKEGHSYTVMDSEDNGRDLLEYSVFFTGHIDGARNGAFVVAHETMHNFGAEDYYDPYGNLPNRKALAEQVYPDDLMMRWDDDVTRLYVSDATAFTVGWVDSPPAELMGADWWS